MASVAGQCGPLSALALALTLTLTLALSPGQANQRAVLNVCFSYTSRNEIATATEQRTALLRGPLC